MSLNTINDVYVLLLKGGGEEQSEEHRNTAWHSEGWWWGTDWLMIVNWHEWQPCSWSQFRINKLIFWKLIKAQKIGVDHFINTVGHFGPHGGHF